MKMKKVVSIFADKKAEVVDDVTKIPQKQEPVFNFDIVVSVRYDSKKGVSEITTVNPAYYETLHSEKITLTGLKNILEIAKTYIDNRPVANEFCIKYEE